MTNAQIPAALRILEKEIRKFGDSPGKRVSGDPFETLVSCVLSLRTKDETTEAAAERLFALARTPSGILGLPPSNLRSVIYPVGFYRRKAAQIRRICRILIEKHGGRVPSSLDDLLEFPGVGRKTANLVITEAFGKLGICVDTHVHRISNRWGYVKTRSPEGTEMALRAKLPRKYWASLNGTLVTYGKKICRPVSPLCSLCRIRPFCRRLGVGVFR